MGAAERAFTHGKSWQGHNLQLAWVMPSNNALNHLGVEVVASQISKRTLALEHCGTCLLMTEIERQLLKLVVSRPW